MNPRVNNIEQCFEYSVTTELINKNFFFVNGHGEETKYNYEVPKGVRIVMFCYSGATLNICDRFDKFNWSNILLDPSTSSNYCAFLSKISEYSSIRDHFCIYEEGDVIKNIKLHTDPYFREGLFRLPVKGYAYDKSTDSIVISSNTTLSDINTDSKLKEFFKKRRTHIRIDDKRVVELMRKNNDVTIIKSYVRPIYKSILLSNFLNPIRQHSPFTVILMVCRDGFPSEDISKGRQVKDEILKMKRRLLLEKSLL
jgi:hypothetical protein